MASQTNPDQKTKDQQQLRQKVKTCTDIIRFHPNGQKYHDFDSARAAPNQRLVRVFGIDNSFTSTDSPWRSIFIRSTVSKMKAAIKLGESGCPPGGSGNWSHMRELAMASFGEYMSHAGETVYVAELVQFVTLKVSLVYLFDGAEEAMAENGFANVKYIGKRINELWIASKYEDEDDKGLTWSSDTRLRNALIEVTTVPAAPTMHMPGAFPSDTHEENKPISDLDVSRTNPMNLILPAYETMWRVVMRCVLEVRYRNDQRCAEWNAILKKYLDAQQDGQATGRDPLWEASENGVAAIDIVKETLRLYPPSRRIHRVFHGSPMSADIEECQRSALLGQDDPLVFRPERWQDICPETRDRVFAEEEGAKKLLKREEEALGFMPFAFVCAADRTETQGFGIKLIALLAAVLSDGLGAKWVLADKRELSDNGIPLDTHRQAYEKLQLTPLKNEIGFHGTPTPPEDLRSI